MKITVSTNKQTIESEKSVMKTTGKWSLSRSHLETKRVGLLPDSTLYSFSSWSSAFDIPACGSQYKAMDI